MTKTELNPLKLTGQATQNTRELTCAHSITEYNRFRADAKNLNLIEKMGKL